MSQDKLKKQRVKDVLDAAGKLETCQGRLDSLFGKQQEIEGSIPKLTAAAEKAEKEKEAALSDFLEDLCGQSVVEGSQKKFDEAVAEQNRAHELLRVIRNKIHEVNAQLHDLQENKSKKERVLLTQISDDENEKLRKKMGDMILRCFALNKRRSSPLSRNEFLQNIVLTQRDENRLNQYNPEIEALFQNTLKN